MANEKLFTINSKVEEYKILTPLIGATYDEISTLSKKKPDGHLNDFKINMVNALLTRAKALLGDLPEVEFLHVLDAALVPQYSDVVMILSQYRKALSKFHSTYYRAESGYGSNQWHTSDGDLDDEDLELEDSDSSEDDDEEEE